MRYLVSRAFYACVSIYWWSDAALGEAQGGRQLASQTLVRLEKRVLLSPRFLQCVLLAAAVSASTTTNRLQLQELHL